MNEGGAEHCVLLAVEREGMRSRRVAASQSKC